MGPSSVLFQSKFNPILKTTLSISKSSIFPCQQLMFSERHISFIASTITFVIFPNKIPFTVLQNIQCTLPEIKPITKYLSMLLKLSKYFCPPLKKDCIHVKM